MKRTITLLFAITAICLLSIPSLSAEVSLGDVLMGKVAPLTMKLSDVTPQWSQFTLAKGSDQAPNLQLNLGGFMIEQPYFNSYFTKGETVVSGGETFLLAYCRSNPIKTVIKQNLQNATENDNGYGYEYDLQNQILKYITISKDTPLNLCLLNLKDTSSILDIHPADIKTEIFPPEGQQTVMEERRLQQQSMSNLRQLALAAIMWSNENEECLPTLSSEKAWVSEMGVEAKLLKQPQSGEKYLANPAMSGVSLGEIKDPVGTPLFYEATPWSNGKRIAAFVDGHVEMMDNNRWEELKKRWNLK